jgi:hypothetical protein
MASAVRLEKLVRSLEGTVKEVEERVRGNEEAVLGLDRRVSRIEDAAKKRDEETDKKIGRAERGILEEMEEREMRKLNVVFHKIGECPNESATGIERWEWDKQSCLNIFNELRLNISLDAIKFCRRLGERREGPRPLVVGFYMDSDRAILLQNAKRLENTKFKEVNVGPDMTKRQRDREAGLRAEMDQRNEHLSAEDRAKNLQWAVVGGRGERRLIKTTARTQQQSQRGVRGAAAMATRGGGRRTEAQEGRRCNTEGEEAAVSSQPPPAQSRGRTGSRRRERSPEEEVEGQPPEKRPQGRQ